MLVRRVPSPSSPTKGLYNPKAVVTHAALLGQACAHCPKFLTAASRRSPGRVPVPVWLAILSDQRPIAALVGRYPANQLIGRGPLPEHPPLTGGLCSPVRPGGRMRYCPPFRAGIPHSGAGRPRVPQPSATRPPPGGDGRVRLACFRHAASVYPEPGSNSPSCASRPGQFSRGRQCIDRVLALTFLAPRAALSRRPAGGRPSHSPLVQVPEAR